MTPLLPVAGAAALLAWAFFGGRKKVPTYRLIYDLSKYDQSMTAESVSTQILDDLSDSGAIHHWQWDGVKVVAVWTPNPKAWDRAVRANAPWADMKADDDFGALLQSQSEEA